MPTITVIIPTHNRKISLQRTLDALRKQTCPLEHVEVIVVADGCSDETTEMLRSNKAPFKIEVIEQSGQGAAAARNNGAVRAKGHLLLFIDDDVEPTPSLIEAHLSTHQSSKNRAVMGPYIPTTKGRADYLRTMLRSWWFDKFCAMGKPGHRFHYRDLLSGNLSLHAELYNKLGGFDSSIRSAGGEDYEFGARLIKAGVEFNLTTEALAYHHEHETTYDINRYLQRARQEGRADVTIGHRHPDLRATLPLVHYIESRTFLSYVIHTLVFNFPKTGDSLAQGLQLILMLLERLKLRRSWLRLCGKLRSYWYLRGVAEKLKTHSELRLFFEDCLLSDNGEAQVELDLSSGIDAVEKRLDHDRPASALLRYGRHVIGYIKSPAGTEQFRGAHLRPILATTLAWPLLKAITLSVATGDMKKMHDSFCVPAQGGAEKTCVTQSDRT
jgi:glycosyltransferase involved in cell wall biosynthesis